VPCDNSLVILPAPPRLPPTSGRAPPAADHRNRRSGELQGSKLTGEVVHNRVGVAGVNWALGEIDMLGVTCRMLCS